ncbi:hypothetical protein AUC68_12085 [Methyloceanibacter methanicus]|uniref:Uncharacterized protein n=1 Tax=Methyloceanibacter methanicus TaxID=1774968 RepID=A0A1E3W5N9_9HYPH|nr:hypothetical protein [Methyloceanibacter methanicus]ODS01111.1 hypothetical protein AUC68_12085 [Methyloceanibacter methanicus]
MRIAIAIIVCLGVSWAAASRASAAPVPLTGNAAHSIAEHSGSMVATAAKRSRNTVRRSTRKCGWQCKRYWRPYQYRYWKFYYPYGGPLFSAGR